MQDIKSLIYFIKDVEQITGKKRLTLRRWWSKNKFPKPELLSNDRLAWPAEIINQWISENK